MPSLSTKKPCSRPSIAGKRRRNVIDNYGAAVAKMPPQENSTSFCHVHLALLKALHDQPDRHANLEVKATGSNKRMRPHRLIRTHTSTLIGFA
jgi:hypothetical protein